MHHSALIRLAGKPGGEKTRRTVRDDRALPGGGVRVECEHQGMIEHEKQTRRRSMVKPHEYLTYRGREGQWAWILHRVTGVGIFIYLLVHIVDTALLGWGPT